jgi:rhodanese-related sulfurtransferase
MARYVNFTSAEENPHLDFVHDVSPDEVNAKRDFIEIIDVRQPEEFVGELGHIAGARLVTLDTLMDHINQLPKDKTIVFVCRSGGRSTNATAIAKDNGLESVFNMKGGMLLWNEMGLSVERDESQ